jgi:hypothetical protein
MSTKSDLLKRIEFVFPGGIIRPVNPICLDGPDYLVIDKGKLFGFFIPTKKEIKHPDCLLRRLLLSKITYIPTMSSVLLCDNDTPQYFQNITQYAFNLFIDDLSLKGDSYPLFCGTEQIVKVQGIASFHKICAQNYWLISNNIQESFSKIAHFDIVSTEEKGGVVSRWSDRSEIELSDSYVLNNRSLLANKKKGSASFRDSMDSFFNYILFSRFDYNQGRFFFDNRPLQVVLNTNWDYVHSNGSLNRYGRALAYLGVLPVTTNSINTIDYLESTFFYHE